MKVLFKILVAILTFFAAQKLLRGVEILVLPGKSVYFGINFTQEWQMIVFLGILLGLFDAILKPLLNLIAFPLRILTLGTLNFLLDLLFLFFLDLIFPELKFASFFAIFLTGLIFVFFELLFS